jgi:hypothetical protein
MSPMQQMLLGVGAKADPVYVDQVFNTYVYTGSSSAQTFNTGVDLANEGGLIWSKYRTMNSPGVLFDTERGKTKVLRASESDAEGTANTAITSFNNNGFSVGGGDAWTNFNANHTFATWIWRKAPGFFDCIKFDGDGTAGRTLSHSLGCVPGMIMIKQLDESNEWTVYHRSLGKDKYIYLNTTAIGVDDTSNGYYWDNTAPTATSITLGDIWDVNKNNAKYVCYLFAGGESNAATARSVSFSSSSTYLSIPDSNDFDFGSTFTFEAWVKPEFHSGGNNLIFEHGSFQIAITDTGRFNFDLNHIHISGDFYSSAGSVPEGQWTHVAVVGTSGTLKMYINGVNDQNANRTGVNVTGDTGAVTISDSTGYYFKGEISNLRIVKGTAVYTSSFRPPTEPLTNITNTKLLCCNDSSVTGSTVTPNTITANGSPTASTDSPFDDPAGFKFGDSKEGIVKCGSYIGNGSTTGPEINLGFEPQFLLCKKIDNQGGGAASSNWHILDSMRGTISGDADALLMANLSNVESDLELADFTSTGFKNTSNRDSWNYNGDEYLYMAIRRSDGYVGKPIEAGTDAFAMDTGASSTTIPNYDSGFPVDFGLIRQPTGSDNWQAVARLIEKKALSTDQSSAEYSASDATFDSNVGFMKEGRPSSVQAWMWKRNAGFDVVAVKPEATGAQIPHNLGRIPEMIWAKDRGQSAEWSVYHKGLNGGTNPEQYRLKFTDEATQDTANAWNDEAPTSTHFTVGSWAATNEMIFMLFASTDVSHVGYYSGDNSGQTITTGFQPRFIIIRNTAGYEWFVFDTVRGWSQNNQDWFLRLDASYAQSDHVNDRPDDIGHPLSTGFYLKGDTNNDLAATNKTGNSYIYYCHA